MIRAQNQEAGMVVALETVRCPESTTIDRVVSGLRGLCRASTFEFAMGVGRLVIDTLYRGDLRAWRSRGPKAASFRKLVKHPDLPMSAAALYRSIAIYELCTRLEIRASEHLSASHFRLVLPLGGEHQETLLRLAEAKRLSVEQLREEVVVRGLHAEICRGGRTRRAPIEASMVGLQKSLGKVLRDAGQSGEPLAVETIGSLAELLRNVRGICDEVERAMQPRRPGAVSGVTPAVESSGLLEATDREAATG